MSLIEFFAIFSLATLTAAGASHGLHLLRQPRDKRAGMTPQSRNNNDEESGRPSAGAWHEPRYGKRHRVSCRIEYAVGGSRLEGMLIDISRQGWRANGSQPVVKGTTMTVYVYVSDLSQPVVIDQAVVRWTDGLEFGVELIRISPDSAARLSDYLSSLYPAPAPMPASLLSPFSYN
jgi:hypothetical protein